jgi:ElaB/YqjD/DUF883 family membrane-anchored ribosome-binding protein
LTDHFEPDTVLDISANRATLNWQRTTNNPETVRGNMNATLDNDVTEQREGTRKVLEDMKALYKRAEDKAVEQAKNADKVIRDHPYQTIGIAFGLGLLIGVLAARRR